MSDSDVIEVGTIDIAGQKLAMRLFNNEVSLKIADEILSGRTYPHVHFVNDIKTIVDVGANVGAASIFFAFHYPQARIFACEPASAPFSLLRQNVAVFPNVLPFPVGLYSCDTTIPLYPGRNDSVESSIAPSNRTASEPEQVQLRCAEDFMAAQGVNAIDILKIDTEGCEVHILRSLKRFLPIIKLIYLEYHSDRDRRLIDLLLAETHCLWRGHADLIYRGEFCYLNKKLIPDEKVTYSTEIALPLD
jgi:FkbM family methyltransferase